VAVQIPEEQSSVQSPVSTAPTVSLEQVVERLTQGIVLRNEGRLTEALAVMDEVIHLAPSLTPPRVHRAHLLADLGRYEEALLECNALLETGGPIFENLWLRDDLRERGLAATEARLAEYPEDAEALQRRGDLHFITGQFDEAEQAYAEALAVHPDHHGTLEGHGHALLALDRREEALAAYRQLLLLPHGEARHWVNFGNVLQSLGALEEAEEAYRQAILREPELPEAHLELGHCRLAAGDFDQGWRQYQWRWRTRQMGHLALDTPQPRWPDQSGGELTGKTILLWAEQGLGDTLQFARYARQVADQVGTAGKVVLRAPAPLKELLASLDPRVEVVAEQTPLPPHDCHSPLMSLPLALDQGAPAALAAYLQANEDRRRAWAQRLGETRRLRVGLAWAGKPRFPSNSSRDIPLQVLLPLAGLDVDWVSLQRDEPAGDAEARAHFLDLQRHELAWVDFAETAALMDNLDLVISVDTAMAHLAGALGKPCWVLLRQAGEWRWQRDRNDSPWYPSLTLFRQTQQGDWEPVVEAVLAALTAMAAAHQENSKDSAATPV